MSVSELDEAARRRGSFLEALRGHGRTVRPFIPRTVAGETSLLAENDLMDPDRVPRSLTRTVQRFIAGLRG